MTGRQTSVAAALLLIAAPVLAFPAVLGAAHAWMAAAVAVVALLGTVALVSDLGHLYRYIGLLGLTSLVGWVAAADQPETINHFCGLALGLCSMGTIAAWCRTRERLTLVTVLFLLGGAVALVTGSRSTTPVHKSKALFRETTAAVAAVTPLPLSALHSRTSVNRNALAAAAMLILPVAGAVALATVRWPGLQAGLRFAGLLTALWAGVVVVMMQSRSAWMSAVVVLWIWARGAMRPKVWWAITGVVSVALPMALIFVWSGHPRTLELLETLEARTAIWQQGLQALRPSPWFGIGLDYFRHSGYSPILVWPDQIVGRPHAHNVFLQTALDVGLLGLVAYLGLMGSVMRRATEVVKSSAGDPWVRHVATGAALSIVSVHVYGLLDAVPLGAKVGLFQWLSCGLVLAAWRIHRAAESSQAAI